MYEFVYTLDRAIFEWLNSWVDVSPFLDWAIVFRSTYLWYVVMAAVAMFAAGTVFTRFRSYRKQNTELFIVAFISAFTARFIITEIIRFFYNRPRPFEVLDGVRQLVNHDGGGSMPSGHASLAFAVATAVAFYYPKTSILFFAAALSISVNRIAAGVHWPSDILGGALVGIGTAWLFRWAWKKLKKTAAAGPDSAAAV